MSLGPLTAAQAVTGKGFVATADLDDSPLAAVVALDIRMEGDELADMMANDAARWATRRTEDEQMRVRVSAEVDEAMDNGIRMDPRVAAYHAARARRETEETEGEMEEDE